MQTVVHEFVRSVFAVPGAFAEVAANDPISAVLLLVGLAFIGVASAAMAYLSLGAAVELVTPT